MRVESAVACIASCFILLFSVSSATAAPLESLIPAKSSTAACKLQTALRKANCFAPTVPGNFDSDCDFGRARTNSYTRRALKNFFLQKQTTAASYTDTVSLTTAVEASPGICPTTSAGTCRSDTIDKEYLQQLTGVDSVRELSSTLRVAIQNFSSVPAGTIATPIFPPRDSDPDGLVQADLDRIKKYGIAGVTEKDTLTSLEDALYKFENLVLAYALKQLPKCAKCAVINDWNYLSNIGSRNFGYLIGKDPTYSPAVPGAKLLKRFPVDLIPENLMNDVRPNVRVYRSITANLNRLLEDKSTPAERLSELIDAQEAELFAMIEYFEANAPSTGPLMKDLDPDKKCYGFDGSQIYQ